MKVVSRFGENKEGLELAFNALFAGAELEKKLSKPEHALWFVKMADGGMIPAVELSGLVAGLITMDMLFVAKVEEEQAVVDEGCMYYSLSNNWEPKSLFGLQLLITNLLMGVIHGES